MRERVEDRHERILGIVRERGSMRVTELAAELGTSLETTRRDVIALAEVGRVRRVHGKVSWPTATLNARDSRLARQSGTGAADGLVLGMVVPSAGYYYHGIIRGARAAAAAAGVRLLVAITEYRAEHDTQQINNMIKSGADGLLLTPSWELAGPEAADCDRLAALGTPVVLMERHIPIGMPGVLLDRVGTDHAAGAEMAVRHLAGLGHRRVALMARQTHSFAAIRRGYTAAVRAVGLPEDDLSYAGVGVRVVGYFDNFDDQVTALLDLIATGEVRAALVHTDTDAVNLEHHLAAAGIRVPNDFALVCYDDELATVGDVPLTAVAPAKAAVGETAVNLLLRRIANPTVPGTHIDLMPELHVRGSSKAVTVAAASYFVD